MALNIPQLEAIRGKDKLLFEALDRIVRHLNKAVPAAAETTTKTPPATKVISTGLNSEQQTAMTWLLAVLVAAANANCVLAGPESGAPGQMAPRALVAADIPELDAAKIASGRLAAARLPFALAATASAGLPGMEINAAGDNAITAIRLTDDFGTDFMFLKGDGSAVFGDGFFSINAADGSFIAANGLFTVDGEGNVVLNGELGIGTLSASIGISTQLLTVGSLITILNPQFATDTPLTIKAMSGQTGALAQFKNSSDAVVAKIDPDGAVTASKVTVGTATIFSGTGTPEGVVTAAKGSLFLRTDGGAGTTLYVKESGTGNTGWVGK